jgi:hypothetical protein
LNTASSSSTNTLAETWVNARTVTITKSAGTTLLVYAFVAGETNYLVGFSAGRIGYVAGSTYTVGSATQVLWSEGGAAGSYSSTGYSIVTQITGLAAGTYTIGLDNYNAAATVQNSGLTVIEN